MQITLCSALRAQGVMLYCRRVCDRFMAPVIKRPAEALQTAAHRLCGCTVAID